MPQLGESVTEGTIARWLKQPGDPVAKYESIAEVASDKVNAEIPAPADGTFGEIIAPEGSVISVGQPICTIEQAVGPVAAQVAAPETAAPAPAPQAMAPAVAPQAMAPAAPATPAASLALQPAAPATPAASPVPSAVSGANGAAAPAGHQHVTPAVRMLLREQGVDLGELRGSGIGGRVTKKDVLEYVQRRDTVARAAGTSPAAMAPPAGTPAPAAVSAAPAPAPSASLVPVPSASPVAYPAPAPSSAPAPAGSLPEAAAAAEEGDQLLPMTSIRRAIADHMVRSRQTSPHAWLMVEVDMSRVVRLREASKAAFKERYGISLTYLPFVARAVVEALRRRPSFNAQWSEAGIVLKHDIHLGIAVALEENLVVPVLRNADRLSVAGLAQAMTDLGNRARANRLKLDEIQGGTFTLNNTGALGAVLTQAIINQPQAAILTMDAVVKRPVVVDDMIAIRPIMNLGMSFDHRLNDGLQAARFLQDVRGQLEGLDEGATLL
jgi:2-oxoisovalerate dehydrogenase E2 component (dihydrolipoyl transacylase)